MSETGVWGPDLPECVRREGALCAGRASEREVKADFRAMRARTPAFAGREERWVLLPWLRGSVGRGVEAGRGRFPVVLIARRTHTLLLRRRGAQTRARSSLPHTQHTRNPKKTTRKKGYHLVSVHGRSRTQATCARARIRQQLSPRVKHDPGCRDMRVAVTFPLLPLFAATTIRLSPTSPLSPKSSLPP